MRGTNMAAGDIVIKGWSGSAGDYFSELVPELVIDYKRLNDGVQATRTIRRKLICLTKNIDLAIAQAKTSGTSLTVPVVNADGTAGTMTFTGRWQAVTTDATEYATAYSLIVMSCRVTVIPALAYDLPALVTIAVDGSVTTKINLLYNGTVIMSWDAGSASDSSGLTIDADLHKRMDYESEDTLIATARLYCNGVFMEQFAVAFSQLPLTWYRGARDQVLYGPVLYPDGELDADGIAALAAQAGCDVSEIRTRLGTVEVKSTGESVPTWSSVGQVSTTGGASTVTERPQRIFPTEIKQTIMYYRLVHVYVRDQDKALRDFRELGLHWTKVGSVLKLMWGRYVWHQWDVTALEPGP